MESWAGPGNETNLGCKVRKYQVDVQQSCGVFLQYHNTWIGELSSSGLHGSKTKKFETWCPHITYILITLACRSPESKSAKNNFCALV